MEPHPKITCAGSCLQETGNPAGSQLKDSHTPKKIRRSRASTCCADLCKLTYLSSMIPLFSAQQAAVTRFGRLLLIRNTPDAKSE